MLGFYNKEQGVKKIRYRLTPFRDIDDQRIMQPDWTRDIPGRTQPRLVVRCYLPSVQKAKISVDSFQRY